MGTPARILFLNPQEALELMMNAVYDGAEFLILSRENFPETFFDLSTGMAGEVLQKFSNYRVRLFIVGNFSEHSGKALADFIRECNKGKQINFVLSVDEVFQKLN